MALDTALSIEQKKFLAQYRETLSKKEQKVFDGLSAQQQISIMNKNLSNSVIINKSQTISLFNGQIVDNQSSNGLSVESNTSVHTVQEQSVSNTKAINRTKITDSDGEEAYEEVVKNEDGTTIKTIYDGNGKEKSVTEFDKNGKRIKRTENSSNGTKIVIEYNQDGKTAKSTAYNSDGSIANTAEGEIDEKGRIISGTATLSDGSKKKFSKEYRDNGDIMQTIYKEDGKTVESRVITDKNHKKKTEIEFHANGEVKKNTTYKDDGTTVDTVTEYDKNGKKIEFKDYVVQNGDTPISLVKKGLEAQGITNPTPEEIKEAMKEFLTQNKGKVHKNASGQFYLIGGQTVQVKGDVDTSKNKTKEQVEADYKTAVEQKKAKDEATKTESKQKAEQEEKAKAAQEGQAIAKDLYKDMDGVGTSKSFGSDINRINKSNVIETIEEYKKTSKDESLIEAIADEKGMSLEARTAAINHVKDALVQRAKALGMDTFKFENAFNTELTIQVKQIGFMNLKKLDVILESFVEEIKTQEEIKNDKTNGAQNTQAYSNVSNESAQKYAVVTLRRRLNEAKEAFKNGTDADGWAGKTADFVSGLWDSENRAHLVQADIDKMEAQVKKLEQAQQGNLINPRTGKKMSFEDAYYDVFGIEFNKDNVISYSRAEEDYKLAATTQGIYQNYNNALDPALKKYNQNNGHLASSNDLAELENSLKFILGAEGLNKLFKDKGVDLKSISPEQKYKLLAEYSKELVSSAKTDSEKCRNGKSLDELKNRYERSYTAAFGVDNDLNRRVTDYVNSQETGAAITKGATVLGATVLTVATCGAASPLLVGSLATVGASMAVEVSDRLTNKIDNAKDLSGREIYQIVKNALIDGGIYAATAGLMKLVPKIDSRTALNIAKQIAMESGIDTGVSVAGDYAKTGHVTKEGVGLNMLIAFVGSSAGAGRIGKGKAHSTTPEVQGEKPHAEVESPKVKAEEPNAQPESPHSKSEEPNVNENNSSSAEPNAKENVKSTNSTEGAKPNQKPVKDLIGEAQAKSLEASGIDAADPKVVEVLNNLRPNEKVTIGTEMADGSNRFWTYENRNGKIVEIASGSGANLPEGCIVVGKQKVNNVNSDSSKDKAQTYSNKKSEQSSKSQDTEQAKKQEEAKKSKEAEDAENARKAEGAKKTQEATDAKKAQEAKQAQEKNLLSEDDFKKLQSEIEDREKELNKLKSHTGLPASEVEKYKSILELDSSTPVTAETLKKARRELSKKYHPDKEGGSTEKMQEINDAIDKLETNLKKGTVDPAVIQQKEAELNQAKQKFEAAREADLQRISEKLSANAVNLKEGEEVVLGRNSSYGFSSGKNADLISRKQIKVTNSNGEVFIENIGKNSITINGVEIKPGTKVNLESGVNKVTMPDGTSIEVKLPTKAKATPNADEQANMQANSTPEEKRGFFKRLFGKKKVTENQTSSKLEQRPELDKYKVEKNYKEIDHLQFLKQNMQDYRVSGVWMHHKPTGSKGHCPWKMHLFSVSEEDWQKISKAILPYLREKGIEHKTIGMAGVNSLQAEQAGKAFTIYPKSKEEFEQIAIDLSYIIKKNGLDTPNTNITGDRALGNTGRIYYRYEWKSGKLEGKEYQDSYYDSNRGEGKYLADDMTPADDPFLDFDPADTNSKPSSNNAANSAPNESSGRRVAQDLPQNGVLEKGSIYKLGNNSNISLPGFNIDLNNPSIKNILDNMPEGSRIIIGRGNDCDIQIPDTYNEVSKVHVIIYKRNGKLYIEDVSSNGTKVAA